jgi:ABC-type multidrug transport system fused ATPase/permease subunit
MSALPTGDKNSHQHVPLTKLFSIILPEWRLLTVAVGGITVSASATMAFPDAIGKMIDLLSVPSTVQTMLEMQTITLGMVGIFSAGAIATFMHTAVLQTVGQRVGAGLRKRLFSRIMNQEIAFFDNNRAGELANRLSTDVHEVHTHKDTYTHTHTHTHTHESIRIHSVADLRAPCALSERKMNFPRSHTHTLRSQSTWLRMWRPSWRVL